MSVPQTGSVLGAAGTGQLLVLHYRVALPADGSGVFPGWGAVGALCLVPGVPAVAVQ